MHASKFVACNVGQFIALNGQFIKVLYVTFSTMDQYHIANLI